MFKIRREICFDYVSENTEFPSGCEEVEDSLEEYKQWSWESKDVNLHFYSVKGNP